MTMDILGRIRDQIDLRRIRLKDSMQAFDDHNAKKISKDRFLRVFSMHGIQITPEEQQNLFSRYCTSDGQVYYITFLKDVENIIPSTQMISENTFGQTKSRKLLPPGSIAEPSMESLTDITSILHFLRRRAQTHGLIVKNFFVDFDNIKTGYVTEQQFRRGMKIMVEGIPDVVLDVLVSRYGYQTSSRAKDVNYNALQIDVDKMNWEVQYEFPWTEKLRHSPIDNSYSLNEVYELFWKKTKELGIRPKDFFKDFDKHNIGFISKDEFCRAMSVARIRDVDPDKIERLANHYYKPENGLVDYNEFCNFLSTLSFDRSVSNYKPNIDYGFDRSSVLSTNQVDKLQPVLDWMRNEIKVKGIHLKPTFQDFDPINEEHITATQFDRVLKRLTIFPEDPELQQLLHQRFCAIGGDHQRINYRRFLEVVDPFTWDKDPDFKTNRVPDPPPQVPCGVSEILNRYRSIVSKRRIRVRNFFEDYDHLRHGNITSHQFEIGLAQAGFEPTTEELLTLFQAYKIPKHDSLSQDRIDYVSFLKDLNAVFTFDGPSPSEVPPLKTLNTTTNVLELVYDPSRLSLIEYNRVKVVLEKLKKYYESHRIYLSPDFQHYDKLNLGYISKSQFKRVLKDLRLFTAVSEDDIELVCKTFILPHRDSRDDVNYRWFVQTLENYKIESTLNVLPSKYHNFTSTHSDWPQTKIIDTVEHAEYGPHFKSYDKNSLLNKLQYYLTYHRIRIESLLEDYTPLKQDWFPKAKLRTSFTAGGFILLDDEYVLLERLYQHPTKDDCLDWRLLVSDLNQMPKFEINSTGDNDLYNKAMKQMKFYMWTETIHAKPLFQSFDPQNIGRITAPQFHRVIHTMGLTRQLSEREVDAVIQKYTTIERDTKHMVDYIKYMKDVENYYNL